jgi:Zn-dependent M28 family amino/carboxypeptidase
MNPRKWLILTGVGAVAALPLFFLEEAPVPAPEFSYYQEAPSALRLVEVLDARPNHERRDVVMKALDGAAIVYGKEEVSNRIFQGTNVVVNMGEGKNILLFAAHFDRAHEAPGANDNASCVAAGIDALKELSVTKVPQGLTVRFLFSDGEEAGLQGARHHADTQDLSNIFGVGSFEMCGIGDAFGVWDVVGPAVGSPIVQALLKAGKNLKISSATHGGVPRFGSDHLAFSKKGLSAVGVTFFPERDEDKLRSYVADPNNPKWLLNFIRPTIFRTYHTSGDTAQTIDPAALDMTKRLMLETVRVVGQMIKRNG